MKTRLLLSRPLTNEVPRMHRSREGVAAARCSLCEGVQVRRRITTWFRLMDRLKQPGSCQNRPERHDPVTTLCSIRRARRMRGRRIFCFQDITKVFDYAIIYGIFTSCTRRAPIPAAYIQTSTRLPPAAIRPRAPNLDRLRILAPRGSW